MEWEKSNPPKEGEDDFERFYSTFEDFMDDSAYKSEVVHKDGVFMLFDGRDGRFIYLGRVLAKAKDGDLLGDPPIEVTDLTDLEKEFIRISVERNFGVKGDFKHHFITVYR